VAATQLAVIEQVKLAYFEWYYIDQAIRVNEQLEPRLQDVISISKTKYETSREGTGLETVLQAQVELSQLATTIVQLEQAREKARANLLRALHAPQGTRFELEPVIRNNDVPRSADLLIALLDVCQPELDALRRESYRDQTAIALAERNYYPDLSVGLNWHAIDSSGLSPVANGEDAFSLMLGVNLPIYQSKLDAAVRETRFNASQTAHRYRATWDEFRANVQSLHAAAIEHDRIVKILDREIVPRSQQALDLSIAAYRVDRITFPQLIESYKTLLRQQIDYYRRLALREQALAQLERAVGCAISSWPVEQDRIMSVHSHAHDSTNRTDKAHSDIN
jgi:outer membrane protein TolC